MNRLVTSSGRSECHHRCWRQSCKNSFLCGWLLHARILYLWGKEIGSCSGLIVKIWIVACFGGKVTGLAPACVSHFSLVPVVRQEPILKDKPALLVTLQYQWWKKTGYKVLTVPLLHLYIICPLVKPAFCFRSFCWFLLLLYRLCHFHLLLNK